MVHLTPVGDHNLFRPLSASLAGDVSASLTHVVAVLVTSPLPAAVEISCPAGCHAPAGTESCDVSAEQRLCCAARVDVDAVPSHLDSLKVAVVYEVSAEFL